MEDVESYSGSRAMNGSLGKQAGVGNSQATAANSLSLDMELPSDLGDDPYFAWQDDLWATIAYASPGVAT
ncbi:hypothetical protein PG991_001434 [Apiospora marii]|uniref:Uncharacterized protein n=1 Tax=Apiospora marii TaxID=335849 RepID=A0ABR1SS24_9PEZI